MSFKDRIDHVIQMGKELTESVGGTELAQTEAGWASNVGHALMRSEGTLPHHQTASGNVVAQAPVAVDVLIRGQALTSALPSVFVTQAQTRHAVNELPSATLMLSIPQAPPGGYVTLEQVMHLCSVGSSGVLKMSGSTVFDGIVGALKVTSDAAGIKVRVQLKHRLQMLKATPRSRIWKAQKDETLLREVLQAHQIHVRGAIQLAGTEVEQRFQWNCTDWHFLRAILGMHGAWLWPLAEGSVGIHRPRLGGKTHAISAKPGAGELMPLEAEWHYSGLTQPRKLTMRSWDMSKQAVVRMGAKPVVLGEGGIAPSSVKPLGADGDAILMGTWPSPLQQAAVDAWLLAQQAQAVRVRLTLPCTTGCQVGDTVSLKGFGGYLDGKGIVTQIEHECDVGNRAGRTVVGVGLDDASMAPSLPLPSGLVIGQVASYQTDPRGKAWNRVPVKVPVLGTEVLWARMGHVYASKHSGVTFYPEVGDEVVLGFDGSGAVILNALHNPQRPAAIDPDAKNVKKGVVLRHNGQRIELSFDRDKSSATLALGADKKPEQQMVIDPQAGITTSSLKGDLTAEVKTGSVTVKAKQKVTVVAESTMALTGRRGVVVDSDRNVKLDAKENLTGLGKASVKMASAEGKLALSPEKADLSAGQVQVTGQMSVRIKGSEAVTVTGAKVDLTGQAKVSLSAPAVSIDGAAEASMKAPHVKVAGEITDVGGAGITNVKGSLVNLG
ncbi:TPA: contractile injection system protein, VgrG/Pvc8 family [Serratia marcescens]